VVEMGSVRVIRSVRPYMGGFLWECFEWPGAPPGVCICFRIVKKAR
jgi:hypothetical protein